MDKPCSLGLDGTCDSKTSVEKQIFEGLKHIAEIGIDPHRINVTMNSFEFKFRRGLNDGVTEGAQLLRELLRDWNEDKDPLEVFDVNELFKCIKGRVGVSPRYFESLIEKYLLTNEDRVTIELHPDPNFELKKRVAELEHLKKIKESFNSFQIDALVAETARMRQLFLGQKNSPEVLATIPRLSLSELSPEAVEYPIELSQYRSIPIARHELPTAGIAYVQICIDLRDLSWEEMQLLELMNYLFIVADSERMSGAKRKEAIDTMTGGLRARTHISTYHQNSHVGDPRMVVAFERLSLECLTENIEKCVDLFSVSTLNSESLTGNREAARSWCMAKEEGSSSAEDFATAYVQSNLQLSGEVEKALRGPSSVHWLRSLWSRIDLDWDGVVEDMEIVMKKIRNPHRIVVSITGDGEALTAAERSIKSIILDRLSHSNNVFPVSSWPLSTHIRGQHRNRFQNLIPNGILSPWPTAERPLPSATISADRSFDVERGHIHRQPKFALDFDSWRRTSKLHKIFLKVSSTVYRNHMTGVLRLPQSEQNWGDMVPAHLLGADYFLPAVRLANSAYMGRFTVDPTLGTFWYDTDKDPKTNATFDVMMRGGEAAIDIAQTISQDEIDQAIIAVISRLDTTVGSRSKAQKAFTRWLSQTKAHHLNAQRQQILSVTRKDFSDFANSLFRATTSGPLLRYTIGPAED